MKKKTKLRTLNLHDKAMLASEILELITLLQSNRITSYERKEFSILQTLVKFDIRVKETIKEE